MKIKATIEVEFAADPGQREITLEAALQRGVSGLQTGIEYGVPGAGPTRIKHGSVQVVVVAKQIS